MEDEEEEEESEVGGATGAVGNLIEVLRRAHIENDRLHYFGTQDPRKRGRRVMPVTPFVFELFIYNSIYQVDWPASLEARCVVNHPRDEGGFTETKQQRELEKFLKPHVRKEPPLIYDAFLPIRDANVEGDWTAVVPDPRISAEEGQRFLNACAACATYFGRIEGGRKLFRRRIRSSTLSSSVGCTSTLSATTSFTVRRPLERPMSRIRDDASKCT
jgi:hypothetical protein